MKYLRWLRAWLRQLSHPAQLSFLVSTLLIIITASHGKENSLLATNAQQYVSPTWYCGGSCPSGSPTPTYFGGVCPSPSATPSAGPSGTMPTVPGGGGNGGTPLDQLIQLIQQLILQLQQLIQQLLGGTSSPTPSPAPTALPSTTGIPTSNPTLTAVPSGGVAVDYSGVPLSVTADGSGTNSNSVQSGTRVSLTNFTIAGSHPNQVVYLALVSKGATDLGNVRCVRSGDQYRLLQKSDWNGDTIYILYRGHGNLSVLPGNDLIDCSWDNRANVNLGAAAFYNVDNSAAEFYSKATAADTSSFPSVRASSSPGNLIFGWGAVGVDIPVAPPTTSTLTCYGEHRAWTSRRLSWAWDPTRRCLLGSPRQVLSMRP